MHVKVSATYKSVLSFGWLDMGTRKSLLHRLVDLILEVGLFPEVHIFPTVLLAVSLDTAFAHSRGFPLLCWNPSVCHIIKSYVTKKVDSSATGLNTKYSGKLNAFVSISLKALKATVKIILLTKGRNAQPELGFGAKIFKLSCYYSTSFTEKIKENVIRWIAYRECAEQCLTKI